MIIITTICHETGGNGQSVGSLEVAEIIALGGRSSGTIQPLMNNSLGIAVITLLGHVKETGLELISKASHAEEARLQSIGNFLRENLATNIKDLVSLVAQVQLDDSSGQLIGQVVKRKVAEFSDPVSTATQLRKHDLHGGLDLGNRDVHRLPPTTAVGAIPKDVDGLIGDRLLEGSVACF